MTDSTETPKILEELSKSNAAKPVSRSSRQQKTARKRIALAVVLLLPLIAGGLFLGYQQLLLQSQLSALQLENQQLDQNLSQQNAELQQLRQEQQAPVEPLTIDDSAVRELEGQVSQEFRQLEQQLAQVQSQQLLNSSAADQEWKILEAEYLLGVANRKLQLEDDLDAAVFLLGRADQALLASNKQNVFAVRQAIASELSVLKAVQPFDREGIYLSIDNLLTQVDSIDLLNSMQQSFENRRSNESEDVLLSNDTASAIDSGLAFLGSIFVWRKWDETPEAMLAPGQDGFIKQNLQLMLGQAQLALLMRDNNLYQQSLLKSRSWLQRYAVTDSAVGQTLAQELDRLLVIDVDPVLPALGQSLSLIGQLVASER